MELTELLAESATAMRFQAYVTMDKEHGMSDQCAYLVSIAARIDLALKQENEGPKRKAKR